MEYIGKIYVNFETTLCVILETNRKHGEKLLSGKQHAHLLHASGFNPEKISQEGMKFLSLPWPYLCC